MAAQASRSSWKCNIMDIEVLFSWNATTSTLYNNHVPIHISPDHPNPFTPAVDPIKLQHG